jgi:glycosyltransferase involved in cell wall biosynthesis
MLQAALSAEFTVHCIGGHALQGFLRKRGFAGEIFLSDSSRLAPFDATTLPGQFKLFYDYFRRVIGTGRHLKRISSQDYVHAVTDYWFDVLPAVRSRAQRKLTLLGMDAPSPREILWRSRPDVPASRLPSVYYWLSQTVSLRLFRRCPRKRMLYVHPTMRERLLKLGYREDEIIFGSNGVDVYIADKVPTQEKIYDAAWIGRVHAQKGIDDLVATLAYLAKNIENFRALLIGRIREELAPRVEAAGISRHVHFSGFVAEEEKFRLFKSSRVFLMPSHYESWGLVIGEALVCGIPVVAYDLPAYRPVFGDFLRYVPCFDLSAYQRSAAEQVFKMRRGENYLHGLDLEGFKRANSWEAVREKFVRALKELE